MGQVDILSFIGFLGFPINIKLNLLFWFRETLCHIIFSEKLRKPLLENWQIKMKILTELFHLEIAVNFTDKIVPRCIHR
jgi:hypothetical protein